MKSNGDDRESKPMESVPRFRFTVGRLMIVVLVAGLLSAFFRLAVVVPITVFLVLALAPVVLAGWFLIRLRSIGARLQAEIWIAALWPLSLVWSLHAAWVVVWVQLGHPPGPADHVSFFQEMMAMILISGLSAVISPFLCVILLIISEQNKEIRFWLVPILVVPLVWLLTLSIFSWDPFQAVWWFMD